MIRFVNYVLASLLIAMCGSVALAQEDAIGQPAVAPPAAVQPSASQPPAAEVLVDAPAFASVDIDATLSVKEFRAELAKGIVEAAEKSETLTRAEKRRIARVMRGGWFNESRKNTILDRVAEKMHAEGVILVTADGVEAAIDWDAILAFIEALIPLIIKLISLFGG